MDRDQGIPLHKGLIPEYGSGIMMVMMKLTTDTCMMAASTSERSNFSLSNESPEPKSMTHETMDPLRALL